MENVVDTAASGGTSGATAAPDTSEGYSSFADIRKLAMSAEAQEQKEAAKPEAEVADPETPEAPDTSQIHEGDSGDVEPQDESIQPDEKAFVPFKSGKESFKVNGKEVALDWSETKKYAQLGLAKDRAFEKANDLQKKAKSVWTEMVQAAHTDPYGLIEILTGKKLEAPQTQANVSPQAAKPDGTPADPRDAQIAELNAHVQKLLKENEESRMERQQNAMKAAINEVNTELDSAIQSHGIPNTPWFKNYLRAQYKAHLDANDYETTIDDLANALSLQLKDEVVKKSQAKVDRFEAKKKAAPVFTKGQGGVTKEKEITSFEEVKKLAGMM